MIWEYVANKAMDISSLSLTDFVYISAHYWTLLNNIQNDEAQLLARGYTSEQLKNAKRKANVTEIGDLIRFTVPITRFEYPRMGFILTLFENYVKGNLPYAGTISEQPAQIMEILNLLQALKFKAQSRQQESELGHGRNNKDKSRTRR